LNGGAWSGFLDLSVLTLQPAAAGDLYGCPKRLSDEMTRRPVIGRIPVHCLVLDLLQGRDPARCETGGPLWGGRGLVFEWFHMAG